MATRLTDEFPARTKAPTAAYPDGSYMNETAPGANDGTPLDERIGDDYEGLKQGLLDKAGITPNGQPDSVTNPQQIQAIEKFIGDGDSQLAGGAIWPLSSQDSAQIGDDLTGISHVRLQGGDFIGVELFEILTPTAGTIDSFNLTPPYSITISGTQVPIGIESDTSRDHLSAKAYGFKTDSAAASTDNKAVIEYLVDFAYQKGLNIKLPFGTKYLESCSIDKPIGIIGNDVLFGAPLSPSIQVGVNDINHVGGGYLFDFVPINRTGSTIADGEMLHGITIKGNATALGAFRVNDSSVIGDEDFARRNFTGSNLRITGYDVGYGYRLYWTFSNVMTNVVVWNCAVTYYTNFAHALNHHGCVYENCSWGSISIDTFSNDHFGCTIEGIRDIAGKTAPADYDTGGPYATANEYKGIAIRTRGGITNVFGGYMEANRVHSLTENNGETVLNGTYIGNTAITESMAIGAAGRYRQTRTRIDGDVTGDYWARVSPSALCNYAEIHSNTYFTSAVKPSSVPNIANVGEFDVFDGTISDTNAARRVFLGQDFQVGGFNQNIGEPRRVFAEQFEMRNIFVGADSSNRTVNIDSLTTASGYLYAVQSGGQITIDMIDTTFAGTGRTLTVIVAATGNCDLFFQNPNFRTSNNNAVISLLDSQTINVSFISLNDRWYQDGEYTILNS